jgi:acyl-CoA thioester hydrolase
MGEIFRKDLWARWGDMDFNGHMRNTAYLDACGDVRMMYFVSRGFSMREFDRLKVGPVIFRDELSYFKEIRLLEPIVVTLSAAALSPDGSRFRLRNEFFREDGALAAAVVSSGGWLDIAVRKLVVPPAELNMVMQELGRSEDFETLG